MLPGPVIDNTFEPVAMEPGPLTTAKETVRPVASVVALSVSVCPAAYVTGDGVLNVMAWLFFVTSIVTDLLPASCVLVDEVEALNMRLPVVLTPVSV